MDKQLSFATRDDFRKWLELNCVTGEPIWLEFHKDGTKGISYAEALEEALCFGWIDSLIRKVDERVYVRKFSKRNPGSRWSEVNKRKVGELLERGLMTEHGLKAVEAAKANGEWERGDEREAYIDVEGLREVLKARLGDTSEFDALSDSLKKHYSLVYFAHRKEETRKKKLETMLEYMKTKKRFM